MKSDPHVAVAYTPMYGRLLVSRRHTTPIIIALLLASGLLVLTAQLSHRKFSASYPWRDYLRQDVSFLNDKTDSPNEEASTWCIMQEGVERFPTGKNHWQQRMPTFVVLGDGKEVAKVLDTHPAIASPKTGYELNSFFSIPLQASKDHPRLYVKHARQHIWSHGGYPIKDVYRKNLHAFEASPNYLWESVFLAPRMNCVCPWMKFLVVLRNPIDRLWTDYAFEHKKDSLEGLMERELESLQPVLDAKPDSLEELKAWKAYLTTMRREKQPGLVGRGLYDIQLRYLFRSMESFGLHPRDQVMVVNYEDVHERDHNELVQFLLARDPPTEKRTVMMTTPTAPVPLANTMDESTRHKLEDLYEPHNQRLFRMLGQESWRDPWFPSRRLQNPATYKETTKVYAAMMMGPI